MFDIKVFKERLRKRRKKLEITQADFAEKVGMARASASYYEDVNNNSLPNVELLYKMCDALKVTPEYLMGLSDIETKDINVQAICEYTGLQAKAVECLNFFNMLSPEYVSAVNVLIENLAYRGEKDRYQSVIQLISNYFKFDEKRGNHYTLSEDGIIEKYVPEIANGITWLSSDKVVLTDEILEETLLSFITHSLKELKRLVKYNKDGEPNAEKDEH